jgi:hypothetical protein
MRKAGGAGVIDRAKDRCWSTVTRDAAMFAAQKAKSFISFHRRSGCRDRAGLMPTDLQRTRTKSLQSNQRKPIYRLAFRDCVINGRFFSSGVPEIFIRKPFVPI